MPLQSPDTILEYAPATSDEYAAGRWLRGIVGTVVIVSGIVFVASFATQAATRWAILRESFDPVLRSQYQREPVREVATWTFTLTTLLTIAPAVLLITGRWVGSALTALRAMFIVAIVSALLMSWNIFARSRTPMTWDRYVTWGPAIVERTYLPATLFLITLGPTGRRMRMVGRSAA